ncbi:MAG: type IX secretion system protein PorQ [Bacteroidota bacterium]|nr:type IX secretion system protein PorQ [Bacteroidota bacterium]
MKKINLILVIHYLLINNIFSQIGGRGAYAFLNMPSNALSVALGSNFISAANHKDASLSWNNPAALNKNMHQSVSVTYNNYVSDINSGYFSYARHFKKIGTFSAGAMFINYGKFDGYNPAGISTGTFTAKDQSFHISYGNQYNSKLSYGGSIKYVYSIYEAFVSGGLSTDFSGMYHDTLNKLTMTAFVRNLGYQFIPYSGTERQNLATEIAFSISKRLEHLPFTYHAIFHNLQRPDMRYSVNNTGQKDEFGNSLNKEMTMGDNILRHITVGGELNFTKHFVVRFGYNHMRRKELGQEQRRGTTGFSWGLGFKAQKINFSYGSATYFPGINSNQFSVMLNLNDFYTKK